MESTNFVDIVQEEVALEGLDGITLPSLWLRLEDRGLKNVCQREQTQSLVWSSLTCHLDLTFYQLPQPRPDIIQFDRFTCFDPESRIYMHPENKVLDIYEFAGVHEGDIMGSCPTFKTRKDITADIRDEEGNDLCSYSEAMERWGRSLVVVASQSMRNVVLTGSCCAPGIRGENVQRYYLLEILGRARGNGLTTGSNLPYFSCQPLGQSSKLLYYMVKIFLQQKLVRKQILQTRYKEQAVTMNLVHLRRFHKPLPNRVKMVTTVLCDYLRQQPSQLQLLSLVKDIFHLHRKSMFKKVMAAARDSLCIKVVPFRTVYPDAPSSEYLRKDKSGAEKQLAVMMLTMDYRDEEEKEEEEEEGEEGGENEEAWGRRITTVWNNEQFQGSQELLKQVYRVIYRYGMAGARLSQVMSQVKLTYRMVRNAAMCLSRMGVVSDFLKSSGVHRFSVYVAKPFLEAGTRSFGEALTEFQQKTTEQRSAPSPRSDSTDADPPEALASTEGGSEDLQATQPSRPCQLLDQSDEVLDDHQMSVDENLEGMAGPHISRESDKTGEGREEARSDLAKGREALQTSAGGVIGDQVTTRADATTDDGVGEENGEDKKEEEVEAMAGEDSVDDDDSGLEIQCSVVEGLMPEHHKHMALPISKDRVTERMLTLANALLDSLKQCRLLDCVAAAKRAMLKQMTLTSTLLPTFPALQGCKKRRGEGDVDEVICLKTVTRIIEWCERENKLRTFSVQLQYQNKVCRFVLVCAADVDKDDPIVLRAIQQHKLRNFAFTASKEIRRLRQVILMDWSQMVCCSLRSVAPFDPRKHQRKMGNKWKKWQKAWWLHRFAWYVIHGYQGAPDSQSLDQAQEEDTEGTPPVYLDTDDWRRYVPPVKSFTVEGCSQEICTIGDLFMVMPLSIFAHITNTQEIPVVREYLAGPQKRHYPVTALPLEVLGCMLQKSLYMPPVLDVFRNLCALGLVAVGPMLASPTRSQQTVYVRKTALLLDTRDSLPGNLFTVLPPGVASFPCMSFDLNSMDDVLRYWATLQTVAFNTNLNNTAITDKMEEQESEEVHPMKDCMSYRSFAKILPAYCLPGNRRGAAGTESGLFIHMRRNWSAEQTNRTAGLRKKNQKGIDRGQLTASIVAARDQQQKVEPSASTLSHKKSSGTKSAAVAAGSLSSLPSTKEGGGAAGVREKRASIKHNRRKAATVCHDSFYPLPSKYRTPRVGKRKGKDRSLPENQRKKGRNLFDDVDEHASQLMRGRRSKFSPKEISIMLLGKVGLTYLCGETANQSYYIPIRDVVHRRMPAYKDKTTAAIYYCIQRHLKRPNIRLSMAHYLLGMLNDKELDRKYRQRMMIKNKIVMCTDHNATIIRDLISHLIDKYSGFETVYCGGVLPLSLQQLGWQYQVMLPEDSRRNVPFTDVASYTDISSVALRDFQLSHLLSMGDKQMREFEMYSTLKQYNEDVVNDTFTRLVHRGVMSRNKKYADGDRVTRIARYMLNHRYQVCLQPSRDPVSLFGGSAQLLSTLSTTAATAGEGGDEGRQGEGGGQAVRTVTPPFLPLPQGSASAGHVALVIGLSALDKIHVQLESSSEIINIKSSKETYLRDERDFGRGEKRGHAASDDDSNDDKERKSDDDDMEGCQTSEPQAKRQKKGDSTSRCPPQDGDRTRTSAPSRPPPSTSNRGSKRPLSSLSSPTQPGGGKPSAKARGRKRSRQWSDSSSEEEKEEEEAASTPERKSSRTMCKRPASDVGGLFITQLQGGEGVREGEEGRLWLDTKEVSIKFCRHTGLKRQLPAAPRRATKSRPVAPRATASFTLLALRRTLPYCRLDPRRATSANRFSLGLSHLALALKGPGFHHHHQQHGRSTLLPDARKEAMATAASVSCHRGEEPSGIVIVDSAPQPSTEGEGVAAASGVVESWPPPSLEGSIGVARSTAVLPGVDAVSSTGSVLLPVAEEPVIACPAARPVTTASSVRPAVTESSDTPSSLIPVPDARQPSPSDDQLPAADISSSSSSASVGAQSETPLDLPPSSQAVQATDLEVSAARSLPLWAQPCQSGDGSVRVDRELMRGIVKRETRLLPKTVDWELWWWRCREELDEGSYTACQMIYRHLVSAGVLGATWPQLKAAVQLPVQVVYDSLQYLVSQDVVPWMDYYCQRRGF